MPRLACTIGTMPAWPVGWPEEWERSIRPISRSMKMATLRGISQTGEALEQLDGGG